MPITIRHEGDIGQMLGLNYLGALGQFRQKQQARQAQQAMGYAKMRADQQSQVFQANERRQLAMFDAQQRWGMQQARELAAQGRAAEARQAAIDAEGRANVHAEGMQKARQDFQVEERKIAEVRGDEAVAKVQVDSFQKIMKESVPAHLEEEFKAVNSGSVDWTRGAPGLGEKWEETQLEMQEVIANPKLNNRDKLKFLVEHWQTIQGIIGDVTPEMMPTPY